jgi:hypothetical protein
MTIMQHSLRVPVGAKVKNSEIQTCNPLAASCHFTQVWQLLNVPDCCSLLLWQGLPPDCYAVIDSWLTIAIDGQRYTQTGSKVRRLELHLEQYQIKGLVTTGGVCQCAKASEASPNFSSPECCD